MNIFSSSYMIKKLWSSSEHRTAVVDQDMSQQEAFDELGQAMATARLASQTSSELTDKSMKDPEKDPEKDPAEEEEEEEEEEFVQHDHQTHGLVSYDNVHKQLSSCVTKKPRDPDYEFEGRRITSTRPLCY